LPPARRAVNGQVSLAERCGSSAEDKMSNLRQTFAPFFLRRRNDPAAEKLYGAIVARARLPMFYQEFSVPDTLAGRFAVLTLHLFAVLHRLKGEGAEGKALAQELVDRFTTDMETVLRETGVGDLSIPKKMKRLAASSGTLLLAYDEAFAGGKATLAAAIAETLPLPPDRADAASRCLASYLCEGIERLGTQTLPELKAGALDFPVEATGSR
jgi:cytochrome b pre-mRNA-processing protein 3